MSDKLAKKTMTISQTLGKKIAATISNDPLLQGTAIQILVTEDCVLLTGTVNQYRKKQLVVKVATDLAHPRTVNQEIDVVPDVPHDDAFIAEEISKRYNVNFGFASDKIIVTVKNGHVQLQGQLSWSYQKDLAHQAISDIDSICDISNELTISPVSNEYLIKKQILDILTMVTSHKIDVRIEDTVVILNGIVSSVDEKNAVGQAIGRIRGIGKISNELSVSQN